MPIPTTISSINKILLLRYGFDYMKRAIFRIVWSSDQLETRFGEHEVYYGSIYLRTDNGVFTVHKYQFVTDRWILERLFPNNREVTGIMSDITYEPLFVFEDKNGAPLEVNERAANFLCWHAMNPKRSYRNFDDEERKSMEKEVEFINDYLNNEHPYLATMMRLGEAVAMPSRRFGDG